MPCEKIEHAKIKKACIKNLHAKNIYTDNLEAKNGEIKTLTTESINGRSVDCLFSNPGNIQGKITPVKYMNGEPQQPNNPGNFNQKVLDELWFLNRLSSAFTNLDSAYGRLKKVILSGFYDCAICPEPELKNCNCPIPYYAVFKGSISNNILNVTEILDTSYTNCPPEKGTIKLGQRLFGKPNKFLNTVITGQMSGESGGVGTYSLENNFNEIINVNEEDMLSLSDVGTEECASIPLKIYGVETLSIGPIGECENITSVLNYNFNISNKNLDTKVAAVYVQVGWEDLNTNEVNIQGLIIDTKQFDYSILSFGEQMNNNVIIPSDLTDIIYKFNSGSIVNSVVQLVLFIEDGLEVFFPESEASSSILKKEIKSKAVVTNNNNYSVSFIKAPCYISGEGKIEPYVQPDIRQNVNLTYSSFSNQKLLSRNNNLRTNGNNYMINSVDQNKNTINVFNIGYNNSLPGSNIQGGEFDVYDYLASWTGPGRGNDFQLQNRENYYVGFNYFDPCFLKRMRFQYSGDYPYPEFKFFYLTGDVSDKSNVPPFVNKFVGIFKIQYLFYYEEQGIGQFILAPIPGQLNVPFGKFVKNSKLYKM